MAIFNNLLLQDLVLACIQLSITTWSFGNMFELKLASPVTRPFNVSDQNSDLLPS